MKVYYIQIYGKSCRYKSLVHSTKCKNKANNQTKIKQNTEEILYQELNNITERSKTERKIIIPIVVDSNR